MNSTSTVFYPTAIVSSLLIAGFVSFAVAGNSNNPVSKPTPEMQQVLDALKGLNGKPIPKLSPEEARKQPTPADAVKTILDKKGAAAARVPDLKIETMNIPGPYGEIPVHIYTPKGSGALPAVVYFHGGGFVIADTKVYDASIRAIAEGSEAVVISVDYHRAPEMKFPSQPNEAYAAYQWVLKNADKINVDPKKVAVAGESAGGNLAAVVSLTARDRKEPLPIHQLLIYPVVDNDMNNQSYTQHANAKPLDKAMMKWFFGHYTSKKSDANSPYALPNKAKTLSGLPPTTLITAEIDPLFTEGQKFATRLIKDGVPVQYKNFAGVTHEFFGMGGVVPEAKEAQLFANTELKKAFNTAPTAK